MGETKRHHYVPQCYLKKFSFDGKHLYTFLIKKDAPHIITEINKSDYLKEISTVDVCVQKDYYSILNSNSETPNKLDRVTLEKRFFQDYAEPKLISTINTFDSLAQSVLKKRHSIANFILTDELKKDLALMTYIQYYRAPRQRHVFEEVDKVIKLSKNLARKEQGVEIQEPVKGLDIAYTHADKTFLNPYLWNIFFQKVSSYCLLLRISTNGNFFTSDNPVVIYKIGEKGKESLKVNFHTDEFCVFFPLTPNLMLEYYCPDAFPDALSLNESISIVNNRYEEQVNTYQYINAEKFVFSHKNDFSLFLKPRI